MCSDFYDPLLGFIRVAIIFDNATNEMVKLLESSSLFFGN